MSKQLLCLMHPKFNLPEVISDFLSVETVANVLILRSISEAGPFTNK